MLDQGTIYQDGAPEAVMTAEHLQRLLHITADIREVDGRLAVSVVG
jgi:ABC-type cobalamin/Fe3+-siderophores transport system ATPase subunit